MKRHGGAGGRPISDILTVAFGTALAMWLVGYFARLPGAGVPSWLLGVVLPLFLLAGGTVAGRYGERGWRGGAWSGLVTSLLNLLVLGALLSGARADQIVPSALWWLPGSLLLGALLGAAGGALGARLRPAAPGAPNWTGAFAIVAASATLSLLVVGGVVTSEHAGLSVVDWPNSFGYTMFLYPLSRMTGGIYFEHAHRLFGSLVGLTTLVLAIHLQRVEERRWVRVFALLTVPLVVVQGILGGLRVTGHFTLSASSQDVAPDLTLAIVHGVLGQLFFAAMVSLAVFASKGWRKGPAACDRDGAASDRVLSTSLVGVLLVQLVLGAVQRHLEHGLPVHITLAGLVVALVLIAGVCAWTVDRDVPVLPSVGKALLLLVTAQVALGVGALLALSGQSPAEVTGGWRVALRTAHQGTGALLLGCAVMLMLWERRLLARRAVKPAEQAEAA